MRSSNTRIFADAWRRMWTVATLVTVALSAAVASAQGLLTTVRSSPSAPPPPLVPTLQALSGSTSNRGLIALWAAAAIALWLAAAAMRGPMSYATAYPERGVTAAFAEVRRLPAYLWLVILAWVVSVVALLPSGALFGLGVFDVPDWWRETYPPVAILLLGAFAVVIAFAIRDVVLNRSRGSIPRAWSVFVRYWVPLLLAFLSAAFAFTVLLAVAYAVARAAGLPLHSTLPRGTLSAAGWLYMFPLFAWYESVLTACWMDAQREPEPSSGPQPEAAPTPATATEAPTI